MTNNIQKLESLISKSNLADNEKATLFLVIKEMSDKYIELFVQVFTENPEFIKKIYLNYKAKQEAIANGDEEAMERIFEEEKAELDKIKDK